jgi:hypothetical protein
MSPDRRAYTPCVVEPVVTKEYCEDLGTKDRDGYYDYAYRYWVYWFDVDGRKYRARVYTDSPEEADVMDIDGSRPRQYDDDLRTIAEYMRREAGVKTILALGASGGFEPIIRFE